MLSAFPARRENRSSLKIESQEAEIELMITASPLSDDAGSNLGTVLFFEDVSQIAKVERMEAWREVARRIAHEIKNPLTPIQLSAERLRRQLGPRLARLNEELLLSDEGLREECTRTIIGEVEVLKRLVNEFSAFARMPHLNPVPGDLNALATETVASFQTAHQDVEFVLGLEPALPRIFNRSRIAQARADQSPRQCGSGHGERRPQWPWTSHRGAQLGGSVQRRGGAGGSRQWWSGVSVQRCAREFLSPTFPPSTVGPGWVSR